MLTRAPDELRLDLLAQKHRWKAISRDAAVSYDSVRRFVSGRMKRPAWEFLTSLDPHVPRRPEAQK